MLTALKRMFQREVPGAAWPVVERWAEEKGYTYRRPKDAEGFILDGRFEDRDWRLEWGDSQRDYIHGRELRLRMDLPLPDAMQLLILSRPLMKSMESETFERYMDTMKTQIDSSTHEEMRWLVMYPKLSLRALPELHSRIVAVGSSLPSVSRWLEGQLANHIQSAMNNLLAGQRAFVLMCTRNRVVLRLAFDEPATESLEQSIGLFQTAITQLPNAVAGLGEAISAWPPTSSSSLMPNEGPAIR